MTIENWRNTPRCKIKLKAKFLKRLHELSDDYVLVGEYIRSDVNTDFKHTICDSTLHVRPSNLLESLKNGRLSCKYCSREKISLTHDYVSNYISSFGHTLISSEYINSLQKLEIACNNSTCRKGKYNVTFKDFRGKNSRCPYCVGKGNCYTLEDVAKLIDERTSGNYLLLSNEYINCNQHLSILHKKCGKVSKITWTHFWHGKQHCTQCSPNSKGERIIEQVLISKSIFYDTQYMYDDCIDKGKLRFDFYIEYNHNRFLLEYDGVQHFQNSMRFSDYDFESVKRRDGIKNEYCALNNITLLRIAYTNVDLLESIIDDFLESPTTIEMKYSDIFYISNGITTSNGIYSTS